MSTLISIAIHDTVENERTKYTKQTLLSLLETVNLTKHRLFLIDNNSCQTTKDFIHGEFMEAFESRHWENYANVPTIITNDTNIGTAEAINKAWRFRQPDEFAIKMDNDVVVHCNDWVDRMEEAIIREPHIGVLGLKRNDLLERTSESGDYHSELIQLPHEMGQRWIVVEKVKHVIGTCQMYSPKLLKRIGYLYQPFLYAFDDTLSAWRCTVNNQWNCFLVGIDIDHIDDGSNEAYTQWKRDVAGEYMQKMVEIVKDYTSGRKDIYYNPFSNES